MTCFLISFFLLFLYAENLVRLIYIDIITFQSTCRVPSFNVNRTTDFNKNNDDNNDSNTDSKNILYKTTDIYIIFYFFFVNSTGWDKCLHVHIQYMITLGFIFIFIYKFLNNVWPHNFFLLLLVISSSLGYFFQDKITFLWRN